MPTKKNIKENTPKKEESASTSLENLNNPFSIQVKKTELTWILGVMVFLLVVLFLTSYLAKSTNSFVYKTLKFEKQMYGTIPVFVYGYTFKDISEGIVKEYRYQLLLRLDPRKNMVPVDGNIDFPFERQIYLSLNTTGFEICPSASRDFATLSGFLASNLFKISTGVQDANVATESNLSQVTCELYPQNTVILLQTANKTEIKKLSGGCFALNIANCETLDIVEKFEVQSLLDSKSKKSS